MRRASILLPLVLAACGEAPPAAPAEPPAAASLSPGQWEVTRTLTKLTKMDDGASVIKGAVGDKATLSACVEEAERTQPPAELLIGMADANCTSDSLYLSGGRVNASLACKPMGIGGAMNFSTRGTYTADTLTLTTSGSTQLAGSGDVRTEETLVARRTGACTAAAAAKAS